MMRLLACVGAVLALLSPSAASARPASCTLMVDGRTYIDGVCDFDAQRDGSFQIRAGDYFAAVSVSGSDRASASWNADPRSTHAHAPLGDLVRKGPCWENARARICARDLSPAQRAAAEAGRPKGEMITPEIPGASQSCVAARDGRWVAGAKLVLRNCRPETDKGFSRAADGTVTAAEGTLCVVEAGGDRTLELAPCGSAPSWSWAGGAREGVPIRNAQDRCWAIPAADDPKARFPFPVVAAPCRSGGKPPLGFYFSKS